SIRSGISLAKKTLNCYYSLTDSSEVYCEFYYLILFTLMQHQFSSSSMTQALLIQDSWIKTAKDLVKDEFKHSYANGTDDNIDIEETI
ncbi:hypothetical protein PAXRUDRAFT_54291, partial [Paxillus rubicundulus Ve08.2h10]